ncbi:hypothetical protein GOODEAATRI_026687 [Goodea atripinnis]|uniref:Corticotropin-releasing factor domain-containing protein n=1 Tax=Goodea atripinnis TaxID=208336 RepID=A0ABV0NY03_9TELE
MRIVVRVFWSCPFSKTAVCSCIDVKKERAGSIKPCRPLETMKPAPLLLLLSSVLLSSHLRPAAGRPHSLPGWLDGSSRLQTQQMDDVLLRATTDSAASDLVGDKLLRLFQWRDPDRLHLLQPKVHGEEDEVLRTAAQLLKRSEEPPLSIDLTFHLLRNMIQMAKMEIQREQAQLNRKVLDEVGK